MKAARVAKDVLVSINPTEPPQTNTLLLIHGRGHKPDADAYLELLRTALSSGLKREYPEAGGLDAVDLRFIYYADLTAPLVEEPNFNPVIDLADRKNALSALTRRTTKQFRRTHYEAVPGKSSLKEFMADVGAPLSRALGMGDRRIARVMPELTAYWKDEQGFASTVRERVRQALLPALTTGSHIMVIAHGLGSVIAYDSFWQLSHDEALSNPNHRIHTWLTLGSPLADNFIRNRLLGGKANPETGGKPSYPNLLINWTNIAAEDDYFCHDETVADDFSDMLKQRLISRIQDVQVYNVTERFGRSNPHSSMGYLIHPRTSRAVHEWLTKSRDT